MSAAEILKPEVIEAFMACQEERVYLPVKAQGSGITHRQDLRREAAVEHQRRSPGGEPTDSPARCQAHRTS